MKFGAILRLLGLALLTLLVRYQASAGNFSFTGHFTQDDNVQWFTFTITNPMPANARATVRTWSYAGGTNAAGQIIPAGGFVPALSIFETTNFFQAIVQDVTGGSIGNDPLHRAADPVTGFALDSYPVDTPSDDPNPGLILPPGVYRVSLTESDNDVDGDLDTGLYFAEGGNGNFTTQYLGTGNTNGSFLQFDGAQRSTAWAVDIVGVDSAVLTIAPPPIQTFKLLSNHQFQVNFNAQAGLTYALQASTNLTNWFEVTNTMLLANGPLQFTDPAATNSTRFYRLSVH